MHGVNLDLLATTPYRADGTPRDPHAQHGAAHREALRSARRARWQAIVARAIRVLSGLRQARAPGPARMPRS